MWVARLSQDRPVDGQIVTREACGWLGCHKVGVRVVRLSRET